MNHDSSVSRRASLKQLGVLGAVVALGQVADSSHGADDPKPVASQEGAAAGDAVQLAVERLKQGHSCAQAVFSAFSESLGVDYQTAVKLTAGFGGGLGLGLVCGSVTGAIMALGLKYGGADREAKEKTAKLVREFTDRFKAQRQSLNRRDLLGHDLSTPEGMQEVKDKKLFVVCPGIVEDAAKILQELLSRES